MIATHSRLLGLFVFFSSCVLFWFILFFLPLKNKIYLTQCEIFSLQQQRQCLQVKFKNYTTCLNLVKSVNQKIEQSINTFGFVLLLGLMLFITWKDIVKLF